MKKDVLSLLLSFLLKCSIISVLLVFFILIGFIFYKGILHINLNLFEFKYTSENISMMPSLINTINMIFCSILLAVPIGIFAAVFLTQYASKRNKLVNVVRIASETLVGIPSIVYGLFGYLAFVIYFGFKTSFIAGALTLSIMILPLILRSSEEALKSVDTGYKEAALALGASKIRTVFKIIIPSAMAGILSGVILSIGKIVGESAALLYTSGTVAKVAGVFDSGRTLSVHMYAISSEGLHINEAYSTAMILIIIVFFINLFSNLIAKRLFTS